MLNTQPGWFSNMSGQAIPKQIESFLSLGPKFSLKTNIKDVQINKLLGDVEFILNNIDEEQKKNLMRAKTTEVITNYLHKFKSTNNNETRMYNKIKHYLKIKNNILILQSDKGGVTVAMPKTDYKEKMDLILNNHQNFRLLNKDLTESIQKKANGLVEDMVKTHSLTTAEGKTLKTYNAVCPKIYGNPKIYKKGHPLRPIISDVQGPTLSLAKWLADILKNAYDTDNNYYISESFHFAVNK